MSYPLISDQINGAGTFDAAAHLPGSMRVELTYASAPVMVQGVILRFEPRTPYRKPLISATDQNQFWIDFKNTNPTDVSVYISAFDTPAGTVPVTAWDDDTQLTNQNQFTGSADYANTNFKSALGAAMKYTVVAGGQIRIAFTVADASAAGNFTGYAIGVPTGGSVDMAVQSIVPFTIL